MVNGVTCSADTQNVMTPSFNSQGDNYLNVYMFSQCSINYFTNKITSLNRYDKTGLVKQLVGWILKTLDLSIFVHLFICEPEKKKNNMRLILMSKIAKNLEIIVSQKVPEATV